MEPNFSGKNHLMLGRALLTMEKKDEAKKWLEKAVHNTVMTPDDLEVGRYISSLLIFPSCCFVFLKQAPLVSNFFSLFFDESHVIMWASPK